MADRSALKKKKLFLLDLDGTLYLGDKPFAGATDFVDAVKSRGGRCLFLTNNSSRGAADYVEKLTRLGFSAGREDFLTSVDALCAYLRKAGLEEKLFYVVGTQSFKMQLCEEGFRLSEDRDDAIDVLLVGFDTELTFQKLEDACILLGRGVDYIATNPDWVCPTWYGSVPDCGSVCEMLCRATGRRPYVIGKPRPDMALLAMERQGVEAEETVLIGDRLYTDIACGVNAGIDTVLVLSGETKRDEIAADAVQPAFVMESIKDYLDLLFE